MDVDKQPKRFLTQLPLSAELPDSLGEADLRVVGTGHLRKGMCLPPPRQQRRIQLATELARDRQLGGTHEVLADSPARTRFKGAVSRPSEHEHMFA
jgi:hypothetical protein